MVSSTINFNFYTTSTVLFNTMSLPLEKKVGTQYGPPGNTRLVYFVDDLNLPEVDPYNTQSAIALLRQHMEYAHVYDMSKLMLKQILNTQVRPIIFVNAAYSLNRFFLQPNPCGVTAIHVTHVCAFLLTFTHLHHHQC